MDATTLLQLLGGLDAPTSGTVRIAGEDVMQLSEAARGALRNRALGFVYQFHHLLPEFTALENVAMPLLIRRLPVSEARQQAQQLLERVGLGARLTHRPGQLSGGERQRVAIARAVAMRPRLLLADEPTGALDTKTGRQVLGLLEELRSENDMAIVLVTHDPSVGAIADRQVYLRDGVTVREAEGAGAPP